MRSLPLMSLKDLSEGIPSEARKKRVRDRSPRTVDPSETFHRISIIDLHRTRPKAEYLGIITIV
jgi:hypothetical protein